MTADDGYAAARALHEQRLKQGWKAVGRKIGFTNRSLWPRYGVYQPIWGTVYDRTLLASKDGFCDASLDGLVQPRIEPEICFKLKAAPPSPAADALLSSIEWIAHSVEIVLKKRETVVDCGVGENVLGSPLLALAHLVEVLAKQPQSPPLAAGEIITTGTLTDAHPVAPGETWRTEIRGLPLHGLTIVFQ